MTQRDLRRDARPPLAVEADVRELLSALAAAQTCLRQLVEAADEKLAAMRQANSETLTRCTAREAELLKQVFQFEQMRKAILARLAQGLRWPEAPRATLSAIAQRVPEPHRSALRARNAALREIAADLEKKNRLAAAVARGLQSHIRAVFAEVAKANQETAVYGRSGQHQQTCTRSWVDAVG